MDFCCTWWRDLMSGINEMSLNASIFSRDRRRDVSAPTYVSMSPLREIEGERTYFSRRHPITTLVHDESTDQISRRLGCLWQYLSPRFRRIHMEAHLPPIRECPGFLHYPLLALPSLHKAQAYTTKVHTGHVSSVGVPNALKWDWISAKSLPNGPESNKVG